MLSLEWNHRRLRVLEGKIARGRLRVTRSLAVDLPEDAAVTADAAALGRWIAEQLRAAGFSRSKAVSCLERRQVVLKRVPLAGVAADEIADFVRLQAMRELTLPVDEAVVDYLRVPGSTTHEDQAVLAVVRHEIVNEHRAVLQAAGIKLVGLWPSSLAQVEVLRQALPADAPRIDGHELLVVHDGRVLEVSLLHEGRFLASTARPWTLDSGVPAAELLPMLRRIVASLSAPFANVRIDVMSYLGPPTSAELEAELADAFRCTFRRIPALTGEGRGNDTGGEFVNVTGSLLLSAVAADRRIDFLAPKKAVRRPDRRRPLAIAAAGILLFAGLQTQRSYVKERDALAAAIKKHRDSEARLAKELKVLRPDEAAAATLQAWKEQEVIWLDVIERLTAKLPTANQAYLTSLSLSRQAKAGGPTAVLRIEGYADTQQTIAEMTRRLVREAGFDVRPGAIQPAGQAGGYAWRFSADLALRLQPKKAEASDQ